MSTRQIPNEQTPEPAAPVLKDENTGKPMFDLATMNAKDVIAAVKAGELYRETALAYEHQQRDKPCQEVLDALA